ncbi:MAG TPA: response regulator transcription factor [Stellaceae bacterium]|nr:response regulator transcription factor [Stellaceae bacterium]
MVVDKNTLVAQGIIHLLVDSDFRVTASGERFADLPEPHSDYADQMLILGLGDNADALISDLSEWKAAHKVVKVIVLSERFRMDEAVTAMKAGASCYLEKDRMDRVVLLQSLNLVLQGALVLSGQFADEMRRDQTVGAQSRFMSVDSTQPRETTVTQRRDVDEPRVLSDRERAVLSHLMRGASNKQIADALGIAEATVKVHVKSLLRKMHVKNRTQAAMWGVSDANDMNPVE